MTEYFKNIDNYVEISLSKERFGKVEKWCARNKVSMVALTDDLFRSFINKIEKFEKVRPENLKKNL